MLIVSCKTYEGESIEAARPKRGGLNWGIKRPQSQIIYMVFFNAIAIVSMVIVSAAKRGWQK